MSARNAPPSSPSSRAHSPALKRSSTEVSTMKRRSCSGEERSSSSVSAPKGRRRRAARSPSPRSSPSRSRSAARYSAAGQPSVRASSAADLTRRERRARAARRGSAPPRRRRSAGRRYGRRAPRRAIRARASAGSVQVRREAISTWCEAGSRGRAPSRALVVSAPSATRCRSSSTRVSGGAAASTSSSAISTLGAQVGVRRFRARRALAMTVDQLPSAVSTAAHRRGPWSSSSSCTHATRSQRAAHCASNVLLPNPAGA